MFDVLSEVWSSLLKGEISIWSIVKELFFVILTVPGGLVLAIFDDMCEDRIGMPLVVPDGVNENRYFIFGFIFECIVAAFLFWLLVGK